MPIAIDGQGNATFIPRENKMARIKIELEDTEDDGMSLKIDADNLATYSTVKSNTCVQNLAILLIEVLQEFGVDKGQLPNLKA